jgi:hypothetical protein
MSNLLFANWLRGSKGPNTVLMCGRTRGGARARRFAPATAELEPRRLLSQLTVTNNGDSGPGSLRAEVAAANSGDVITFAASLRAQTITLASPLMLSTSVTIKGFATGGPSISGNGSTEIFVIPSGASVTLAALRIENGSAANGGAIDNSGNLTIRSCSLLNNQAVGDASTAGAGGAIDNEAGASLTLLQSRLTGNQAIDNVVSGSTASGGALADAAGSTVIIRNSIFASNQALSTQGPNGRAIGGAISNTSATLVIAGSSFNGNSARAFSLGQSGAIDNRNGVVTIASCTFVNNQAVGTGTGG